MWFGQSINDGFMALADARLGRPDEARRRLEKVDRWLADVDDRLTRETFGFPPGVFPSDWLIVLVIRREADRTLAGLRAGTVTR
jgi:hypothetical protein